MFTRTVSADDLARFKRERGRRRPHVQQRPHCARPGTAAPTRRGHIRRHLTTSISSHHSTSGGICCSVRPVDHGWRGRLRSVIWSAVAPLFERQHAFNAALVEHLNRNTSVHREVAASAATTLAFIHEELVKAIEFQARIVQYVQTVTPYVDTKDREIAGLMRWINEDRSASLAPIWLVHWGTWPTSCANGQSRWQRRERRYDARERQYVAQVEDVRASFAVVNQVTLKRELERFRDASPPGPHPQEQHGGRRGWSSRRSTATSMWGSKIYIAGRRRTFGIVSAATLRTSWGRPMSSISAADGGEFLELLRDRGIAARGIDSNHEMVEFCKERGLVWDEDGRPRLSPRTARRLGWRPLLGPGRRTPRTSVSAQTARHGVPEA